MGLRGDWFVCCYDVLLWGCCGVVDFDYGGWLFAGFLFDLLECWVGYLWVVVFWLLFCCLWLVVFDARLYWVGCSVRLLLLIVLFLLGCWF